MTPNRWKLARQITQIVSTLFFLTLAFLTFRDSPSIVPVDLYFRVDPLVAVGAMIAERAFITTFVLAIIALLLGFVFGRAWCGWLCPLGAMLDWTSPSNAGKHETHAHWRGIKYFLLFTIAIAALMGNLTFMFLDPITLFNRTFASAFLPALNVVIVGIETIINPFAPSLVDAIEQNFRFAVPVLPAQQTFYQMGILFSAVFALIVVLNWVASRFWCRYLCPLGAIYALQARFAFLQPRAVTDCEHCAACVRACPTSAITVRKTGFSVEPSECVMCMDCATACPTSTIAINFALPKKQDEKPTDSFVVRPPSSIGVSRRQFIGSAAAAVTSVALFRSAPQARRDDAFLIRPPGARENDFLSKCIRCSECVKVCPTGTLQPSLFESGIEGFWSPLLQTRLGYCDYSCNACGQICPTGAIPLLSLEEKRNQVIGLAYIDQNRCIPWSAYRPCVVCEEMCPVPEKAIRMDDVNVTTPDGKQVHVQRPRVITDLCIGCGICEYQCPLQGPAAIRVYVPTQLPPIR